MARDALVTSLAQTTMAGINTTVTGTWYDLGPGGGTPIRGIDFCANGFLYGATGTSTFQPYIQASDDMTAIAQTFNFPSQQVTSQTSTAFADAFYNETIRVSTKYRYLRGGATHTAGTATTASLRIDLVTANQT